MLARAFRVKFGVLEASCFVCRLFSPVSLSNNLVSLTPFALFACFSAGPQAIAIGSMGSSAETHHRSCSASRPQRHAPQMPCWADLSANYLQNWAWPPTRFQLKETCLAKRSAFASLVKLNWRPEGLRSSWTRCGDRAASGGISRCLHRQANQLVSTPTETGSPSKSGKTSSDGASAGGGEAPHG